MNSALGTHPQGADHSASRPWVLDIPSLLLPGIRRRCRL